MLCLACGSYGYPLCAPCSVGLKPTSSFRFADVRVHPGWAHTATAAALVHNLKYRRSMRAGWLLAHRMAAIVPGDVDTLVPVPRVLGRRIAYGIDQAVVLADMVHDLTGVRVVRALRAPMWHRRLAGRDHDDRSAPSFVRAREATGRVALVDDVFTTGTTVRAAMSALGASADSVCLSATAAVGVLANRPLPKQDLGLEVTLEIDPSVDSDDLAARVVLEPRVDS